MKLRFCAWSQVVVNQGKKILLVIILLPPTTTKMTKSCKHSLLCCGIRRKKKITRRPVFRTLSQLQDGQLRCHILCCERCPEYRKAVWIPSQTALFYVSPHHTYDWLVLKGQGRPFRTASHCVVREKHKILVVLISCTKALASLDSAGMCFGTGVRTTRPGVGWWPVG